MIELRDAAAEDLDALLALERSCFPDPWVREMFADELACPDSVFLVAVEETRLLGFVILRLAGPEGEVYNIAVAPEIRGRGIGRRLLQSALDRAERKGTRLVFLEVREGNLPAQALYRSLGFRPVGLRKKYYEMPVENAVVMARHAPEKDEKA